MTPLLRIEKLVAGYGEARVLSHIDLTVEAGRSLALLGRNGAGKTTLVDTIAGVTTHHAGAIHFDGRDIARLRPEQRAPLGIGWVPQERNIFPSLTVEENLTATRLMTTFGVAMLLAELGNQAAWLTGGADGLSGISMEPVLGLFEFDLWGRTGYIYCLAVLIALTYVARRIVNSPFGLSLMAIKRNPRRAAMIGISPKRRIVVIYAVSAAYAGMAGALLAQTTNFVSPDVLAFHRSADVLLVLVIGGAGYLYGGIFGAIIFTMLRDWLSVATPQYWMFWIGLILVAIVMIGRERLTGWPALLVARLKGKEGAR